MAQRACIVENCGLPHYGKGWCSKHYTRMRRYGSLVVPGTRESAPEGHSWCGDCLTLKPVSEFYRHSGTSNGLHAYCKPCHRARNGRNWANLGPERRKTYRDRAHESRLDAARRRRARVLGRPVEKFSRQEIAERDDWRCQLCGKAIPQREAWPHPLSLSVDHVIPIDAGGGHTRSNVQATHLRCNIAKGTRGTQQLRLIG